MSRIAVLATCLTLLGCHKDDDASDTESAKFFQSLKLEDFCASTGFLKLSDEGIREDIGLLCSGNQPTDLLATLIKNVWRGEAPFSVFPFQKIEEVENERSSFLVGFSTKIPVLNPAQIRESGLNQALQMNVETDFYNLSVEEVSQTVGEGLNFLKMQYRYKTLVKGPQSTEFRNERLTEINHYQVTAMREDLALSTEHLLENEANQDYDWARTTVLIVGDPKEGGSYLITLINYRTWNQGFHKINTRALEEITKLNAQRAYEHLLAKSMQ